MLYFQNYVGPLKKKKKINQSLPNDSAIVISDKSVL